MTVCKFPTFKILVSNLITRKNFKVLTYNLRSFEPMNPGDLKLYNSKGVDSMFKLLGMYFDI